MRVEERYFFVDNLLVRIHFIIVMTRWTGLAPWEFEFPFPGSLTSTFLERRRPWFKAQVRVDNLIQALFCRPAVSKQDPSRGISTPLSFLEPFCGYLSPKVDKS